MPYLLQLIKFILKYMKKYNANHLLSLLFLSSLFLICLTKIVDPDAWLHLSLGREIFSHRGIPATETLTYPSLGRGFGYGSWLFGLIYYTAYHFFNVYGVILLKALTITAAFYFLLRDSLLPHKNYPAAIIVLSAAVFITYGRFIERPDTFLMLFLAFTIYALNAFIYENKKYIYALPLILMLWANTHASINLMLAIFLPYLAVGILRHVFAKFFGRSQNNAGNTQPYLPALSPARLKIILLIFILSFASSLINPVFIKIYTGGSAQVLTSSWWQDSIAELARPTWETGKIPFILPPVVFLSFILNWFVIWRKSRKDKAEGVIADSRRSIIDLLSLSLVHLLVLLPFIALSFKALRFIFLLGIIAAPITARNISQFLSYFSNTKQDAMAGRQRSILNAFTALAAIWIIIYSSLYMLRVAPVGDRDRAFGFGFNSTYMPEGALKYMDAKNIYGRIFNTFQYGQYIAWRDLPKRSAFVDGRGYLPTDLLESLVSARAMPSVLNDMQKKYGFEAALLNYPAADTSGVTELHYDIDNSFYNPDWALVYWDDVSTLYLRRGGPYDAVIKEDEYRFIKPGNSIENARSKLHDGNYRDNLIRELQRNITETGSSKAYVFSGFVYNETGLYREAVDAFLKVRDSWTGNNIIDAYNGMGYAYFNLGYIDEALRYYKKSLDLHNHAPTLYNIGALYLKKGDAREAKKYLEKALDMDSNFLSIYPLLISAYEDLGMKAKAAKARQAYDEASAAK